MVPFEISITDETVIYKWLYIVEKGIPQPLKGNRFNVDMQGQLIRSCTFYLSQNANRTEIQKTGPSVQHGGVYTPMYIMIFYNLHGSTWGSVAKFEYERTWHGFWRKHALCFRSMPAISGGSTVESQIHRMNHLSKLTRKVEWETIAFPLIFDVYIILYLLFTIVNLGQRSKHKHPIR